MNIRRKLRAHSTEVHTGPLNDILFILLLFFLIASTLANPNLKKVNNPRGTKDTKARQTIVVSIDKDNNFFIGTNRVESAMLDSALALRVDEAKKKVDTPSVIVNADTASSYGNVFRVLNLAEKLKVKKAVNIK
jgi:biopolymer transport protein ExbD